MSGGHTHDQEALSGVPVGPLARRVLLGLLAIAATATVIGLVALWPNQAKVTAVSSEVPFAAPGVSFPHADILRVLPACPSGADVQVNPSAATCGLVKVTITSGSATGSTVWAQNLGGYARAGLQPGDSIQLMRVPGQAGSPDTYSVFGVDRGRSLLLLVGVLLVVVLVVARMRGFLALLAVGVAGAVLVRFILPALLIGEPAGAVALVGASAIMVVVLYLAHGFSMRTSAALAGTLVGVGITAAVASVSVEMTRLSGIGDDTATVLSSYLDKLNFQGLLTSAIIIAGLGVLNDVTITQASAVWELRAAGPELSRTALFRSAMRIGRDHIASTIYTIVFAYAGAALSVMLMLYIYDRPVLDMLGTEDIAAEAVRTACSAIGLVLAVPATTAIAVLTVAEAQTPREEAAEPPVRRRSDRHRRAR